VAVCDQVGQPQPGKIVKRALTRIFTAGTTLEDHQIDSHRSHYLLALDFSQCAGCSKEPFIQVQDFFDQDVK